MTFFSSFSITIFERNVLSESCRLSAEPQVNLAPLPKKVSRECDARGFPSPLLLAYEMSRWQTTLRFPQPQRPGCFPFLAPAFCRWFRPILRSSPARRSRMSRRRKLPAPGAIFSLRRRSLWRDFRRFCGPWGDGLVFRPDFAPAHRHAVAARRAGDHRDGLAFPRAFPDRPALSRKAARRAKAVRPLGRLYHGARLRFRRTPCIGPILAAILAIAASEETAARGAGPLAVYSFGLGVPFLLAAAALEPFLGFLKRFRTHFGAVERVVGVLLIATGIAFLTGTMQNLSFWLLQTFPGLAHLG